MKKLMMAVAAALFVVANAFATDSSGYYVYKSDAEGGTGGWSDSTRWRDGVAPSAGDKVKINSTTGVTATDGDMTLIATLSEILVNKEQAVLTFTLASDGHVTGALKGDGKVVKNGTGALYLDKTDAAKGYFLDGGFVINDGELHFPTLAEATDSTLYFGPVTVNAPGVLYTVDGCSTEVKGLAGDGSVQRNTTATGDKESQHQLKCAGGKPSAPFVFSGTLGANVSLSMNGGNQRFTRTDETVSRTIRLYAGLIELTAMNGANGDSVTTATSYQMRGTSGKSMTLRYVGEGAGTCSHTLVGNSDTYNPIIDGGSHGELTLSGKIQSTSKSDDRMCCYTFAGDHTVPCVFTGAFEEKSDLSVATYITKTGTGTWRFAGSSGRKCNGVFEVRNGTLEFDSIAERGTICSLGYQNVLHENYFGAKDDARAVPYAFRLGDGTNAVRTTTGTLSYVGATDGACSTRPIALSGAGRLRNASDYKLEWTGVTSLDANGGTLVLDGSGTANVVRDVTNGVGTVSVVKEGSGTWCLDGDLDVSGTVAANGGVLTVCNSKVYRWFRLNIRSTWYQVYREGPSPDLTDTTVMLKGMTLTSEDGTDWASSLAYNQTKNNEPLLLLPGEACYGNAGSADSSDERNLGCLFRGLTWQAKNGTKKVNNVLDPDDSNTWVRIVMRLPDDASPIVRYDFKTGNSSSTTGLPYNRELRSWSLEASLDGLSWTTVADEDRTTDNITPRGNKLWYSTGKESSTGLVTRASCDATAIKSVAPAAVGAADGGVLAFCEAVTVRNLSLDAAAASAGVISNVTFAAGGTISVTNAPSGEFSVPFDFGNATGVENVSAYSVLLNGSPAWRTVTVADGTITFTRPGLLFIVK